jgi:serine/threonine protein kinase
MQQQSFEMLFCDECGLANDPLAEQCAFCQHVLTHSADVQHLLAPAPVIIAAPPVLEVMAGEPMASKLTCDFQPGSLLAGRYQIREEIGRGGFSTVYRAVDMHQYQREVAIKRVQLNTLSASEAEEATATLNREITMLARFREMQGFPLFYELLTDDNTWCLVTQYVHGQTLDKYMSRAPGGYLPEREVVEFGLKLVKLMQQLHEMEPPVIFRDLKPENIILTPQQELYLIDFGIARTFKPGKTRDTIPLGSPGYAAPEQYGRAQTDQRSDIYSLGATLQTLLTGRDPLELRAGEPAHNPRPPSRRLRALLRTMLAPAPTDRPPDLKRVEERLRLTLLHVLLVLVNGLLLGLLLGPLAYYMAFLPAIVFTYVAIFISFFLWKRFQIPKIYIKDIYPWLMTGVLLGVIPWIIWILMLRLFSG